MNKPFEGILRAWLLDYDERIPNEKTARREAFLILLGNLSDYGYNKEELNSSRKEKIVRICINPNHKNKSKLRKWVNVVIRDLEIAISIYYPEIKIRKDNIITQEMQDKLNSIQLKEEATKSERSESSDDSDTEEDFKINYDESLNLETSTETTKVNKDVKHLEITDDLFDDEDGPTVIYDTDFMKRLGLE